ncbi:MAG TPA: 3-phosphoserine/phosphohydroxythreonine transaminase [Gemmatimonadales bacterium]|jgi:phosphoserine aminotransferase|nr:3-phosphoserine/phosphohydroxythreonine transaminase [Gemmatimonadales bacterium]
MTDRIYNFSAGPAVLPEPVLRKAQEAIWNIAGSGIGIMEHSHRGKVFDRIIDEAEATCRSLAGIPDDYDVLFLQGGASLQFSMVPMNLLPADRTADFLLTGVWAKKAVKEAKVLGRTVHLAASSEATNFDRIPQPEEISYSSNPAYVHLTTNNTIYGTQWKTEPAVPAGAPLVADTSSDMYSRPIDVRKYGLIYAGAQKNLGPSGVVLVIVRKALVEAGPKTLPTMLQYRTFAADRSMYNTPPTFGIYIMGEVFKWIESQGGLAAMADRNAEKAALLYDYIDASDFFHGTVQPDSRSLMNVCFRAPTEELEGKFIAEATRRGLDGLKGHRSVGGMRASIYNACPRPAVEALVAFMKEFEQANRAAAART